MEHIFPTVCRLKLISNWFSSLAVSSELVENSKLVVSSTAPFIGSLEPTWPLHRFLSLVFLPNLSILFLGGERLNRVYDPGFLLQQALATFPHGRREVEFCVTGRGGRDGGGGEAAAQTESGLSRRFSNYTLETNQPEHCFLISRTKQ